MALSVFDDKTKPPKTKQLYQELGGSAVVWQALTEWLADRYDPLAEGWMFGGKDWGWTRKLMHKKRAILYMTPCEKHFLVGFILGDKAVSRVLDMGLPKEITKTIKTAKKYVEGRAIRLEARYKKDLPVIQRIVEAKMSS